MQVSVEQSGPHGRKLTISIPSSDIQSKVDERLTDLAGKVRLKGFRPGRVPATVMNQRFGQRVRAEVVSEVVQQSYADAISQENLRPATEPEIDTDEFKSGEDYVFSAAFDVFPEIESMDLSTLKVTRPVAEVGDADIDQMIETLRDQRRDWTEVDRAAKDNDLVLFQYALEAGDDRHPDEDMDRGGVVLGTGAFDPAIEKKLSGQKGDEELSATVTLSDDFRLPQFAGRQVKATLKLDNVQESDLPEVDDEFMASFGVTDGGMDAFREEIKANLQRELDQALSRKTRKDVMATLIEHYPDLDVPESLLESEQQSLKQHYQNRGEAEPEAEGLKDQASRRVRAALLISEVARHAGIEIDPARVSQEIASVAATYEDPQSVMQQYLSNQQLMASVQNKVLEDMAVEWVIEQADVSDKSLAFQDLMQPGSQDQV